MERRLKLPRKEKKRFLKWQKKIGIFLSSIYPYGYYKQHYR